jgi:NAD(P)-dependent dehydrogenase (short-subunit alcohol dehydrogenase family)
MKIFLTGASAGIGLAAARALTGAGCEVWGSARQLDRLPTGLPGFHPVALDLADEVGACESFADALRAAGGRFDVLINNGGGGWFGPGAEIPAKELRAQFQVLALSPIALIQAALPSLRSAPGGLVINVTSLAARLPLPYGSAYSAAKAALSAFTAVLQMEETAPHRTGEFPVRWIDLQPGDIRTGFNRALSFWAGLEAADDPVAASVRRSLKASDASMAAAPPPEKVAERIRDLVLGRGNAGPRVTCGNLWQGVGGSLAYRLLPRKLLLWTIRKNCGL